MSSTNSIRFFQVPQVATWLKSHQLEDLGDMWLIRYGGQDTVLYLETLNWLRARFQEKYPETFKFRFEFTWKWICENLQD